MSGEWLKLLQEGRIEREKLQEQVQDIRNMFLNIKLNSDMFLKIMRLEQREIQTNLKIAALEKEVKRLGNLSSTQHQTNINLTNKVLELENHDIFKIWTSMRKGGKTTIEAILNNNRGFKSLRLQIASLQEQLNEMEKKEVVPNKICPECGAYYKGTHTLTDCNYYKGKDSGGEKEGVVKRVECIPTALVDADPVHSKLPEVKKSQFVKDVEKFQDSLDVRTKFHQPDFDVPYCYQDKCVQPYKTPESLKWIKEFFEKKKTEKNKDYENFVQNYEGYWKSEYDKLIEEFVRDLNSNMWITEIRKKWLDRR